MLMSFSVFTGIMTHKEKPTREQKLCTALDFPLLLHQISDVFLPKDASQTSPEDSKTAHP